jgi:long-chain acyl-CoA synthetase
VGGEAKTAEHGTGAKTLAAMVLEAIDSYDDNTALKYHDGDDWTEMSYADFGTAVREIAGGLIELGIEAGDRVAIFSDTRAEWTLADIGAVLAAATVVPIYHTSSAEEAEHVLGDSDAKLVFCENEEILKTAKEAASDLDIEQFVLFEGSADGTISLDELREKGKDSESAVEERAEGLDADDVFTIIYTSGTTGPPKGCVLTHGNYRSNAEMLEEVARIEEGSVVFIFLPLAHALSRMTQMVGLDLGATLGFWQRDKEKMLEDLKEIAPTHFPAVPRIFEKIYEQARSKADGKIKGKVFEQAVEVGREVRILERQGEEPGPVLKKEYDLADKQVLSKVREIFGGNLELAITGAAPVAKEMLEFFDACGVLILEGYGSTETSAVVSANSPDDFKFGTVGRALPGSEVKIEEAEAEAEAEAEDEGSDDGDDSEDDGRGELLVKGPHVFQGYHGLEDETKEVLDDDGWFRTGDLATIDDEGFITIAGRTKEIIVTSSGKNITPTNIEEKIADSPLISQAVVYGDDRPYLVALVTLDEDNTDGDKDAARDDVQKAIDEANKDLAKIEQVKKFTILDRDLSQDEDELTPTLKIKREKVYENFQDEIDALYDDDGDDDDS